MLSQSKSFENRRFKRKASDEVQKEYVYIDRSPFDDGESCVIAPNQPEHDEPAEIETQKDNCDEDDTSSVDENFQSNSKNCLEQESTIPATSESPVTIPRHRPVHDALFPPVLKAGFNDIDDSTASVPDDLFNDFCDSEDDHRSCDKPSFKTEIKVLSECCEFKALSAGAAQDVTACNSILV
jgi:hypothetical protein